VRCISKESRVFALEEGVYKVWVSVKKAFSSSYRIDSVLAAARMILRLLYTSIYLLKC